MNLEKELIDNQILLSIFAKEYYNESIFETLRNLPNKKICYVALNKTASSLQKTFHSRQLSSSIFFIDALSLSLGQTGSEENVIFVSSPAALTELSLAITAALKSRAFDLLLFDSLSTLTIYEKTRASERFTSFIINKLKSENKKGIFTCLEEDLNTDLIKNSFMYIDKVIRYTELYEQIKKKQHTFALASLLALAILPSLFLFNLFSGQNQLTGFTIFDAVGSGEIPLFPNLFLIGATTAAVIYFTLKHLINNYKDSPLKNFPQTSLLDIKPLKEDKQKLKKRFQEKINHWLKKNPS